MKTLIKFILAAMLLTTSAATQAGPSRGYFQSSTRSAYVYRNPYAAYPSVRVNGYCRSSGTYVAPYVRTPANYTVKDNISYRGYGTIRVPRY